MGCATGFYHRPEQFIPTGESNMGLSRKLAFRTAGLFTLLLVVSAFGTSCTLAQVISFAERPAAGYNSDTGKILRIAIVDETGAAEWTPAIVASVGTYDSASAHLVFQSETDGANIVMRFRRYNDSQPPHTPGYLFARGVGGFATVYDSDGVACNFPPSSLPLGCSGEIASATIYLNDAIPPGHDIEARRGRLLLHEMGHAMGLERHSPDLDIAELSARYGWD
jgi:hypothetical protein